LGRGRTNRAFTPSSLAKIFGDKASVPSRHWLTGVDRLYQRAIRSEELVPIAAVGVVEQLAGGNACTAKVCVSSMPGNLVRRVGLRSCPAVEFRRGVSSHKTSG
jgi:hypothetical protein